jgi:hypothetical protein
MDQNAMAEFGRWLPLAIPMNERLLVTVVAHSKAAVPVSASLGP